LHQINYLTCWNFYTGIKVGELSHIQNLYCFGCINSVELPAALDVILIQRLWEAHSKNGIKVSGASVFQILQMNIEHAAAASWNTRVYDVDDPSNNATADITWRSIDIAGSPSGFVANGASNVKSRQIGSVYP
jgi:hypothetical protein